MEQLIILGAGIAGLTAAVYAARAHLNPLVIGGNEEGGQLMLTTAVDNFPGFPDGILGPELIENTKKQAEKFGARFKSGQATGFEIKKGSFEIKLQSGDRLEAKSVIIATGASARWLGIPSEKQYQARGVHTCATCDAYFYKEKIVYVVGGGDSAMEESLFIAKFAKKVIVLHRRDSFRASKIMQDKFFANPKCSVLWNRTVEEIKGDGKKMTGLVLKDTKTGKTEEVQGDGLFLAVGHIPNTDFVKGKLDLDDLGYLIADDHNHTNIRGVFAAGDVHDRRFKQAVTAAGSGCMAAMEAEKYLGGASRVKK